MDSLQHDLATADPAEDTAAKAKAFMQLNQSTISDLEKIIKDDPVVDLWLHLREIARRYKTERDKYVEKPKPESDELASDRDNRPKHLLSIRGVINIRWPLAPNLAKLLQVYSGDQSQDTRPDPISRSTLSDLIQGGEWISQEGQRAVVRISPDIVVKISTADGMTELTNLQHIRKVSRIVPVPDALGMIQAGTTFYAFSTFVPGIPLDHVWGNLTSSEKANIQQQLNTIFTELRSLPLPSKDGFLGGGDPPFCQDMRRWTRRSPGLIKCEAQFNYFLLSEAHANSEQVDFVRPGFRNDHRIVMTHSDLHPRNIIIDNENNLRITGIIDWEVGGGYPEYWEYVKALQTAFVGKQDDWYLFLPDIAIGNFIDEYIRDNMIDRMVY